MGIKQSLKNLKDKFVEGRKEQKEISQVKQNAYVEEMRTQALMMGKKQAQLEAKQRVEVYEEKLRRKKEELFNKKDNVNNDIFGLQPKDNKTQFDFIGKSYFG